jgi:hypothetical protein
MKVLYTDAGYTWQNTKKTPENGQIMGRICVADEDKFSRVENVGVGKVPVLIQYINIFELVAIARAIEIAIEKGWVGNLAIRTDSKVAMIWASSGKIKPKVATPAHLGALEYLKTARRNYIGVVTYHHVPRHLNYAGIILEKEKLMSKKERWESTKLYREEEIADAYTNEYE